MVLAYAWICRFNSLCVIYIYLCLCLYTQCMCLSFATEKQPTSFSINWELHRTVKESYGKDCFDLRCYFCSDFSFLFFLCLNQKLLTQDHTSELKQAHGEFLKYSKGVQRSNFALFCYDCRCSVPGLVLPLGSEKLLKQS